MVTARAADSPLDEVGGGGFIGAAIAVAAVAVAAQTAADLVNALALDGHFGLLDASAESSLGAWACVSAIGAAAIFTALGARARAERRGVQAAIAVGLGFLALDDAVGLHERLVAALEGAVPMPPAVDDWPTLVIYAPLLLFVAVGLWRDSVSGASRRLARAGILVLGAALAVRPLGAAVILGAGRSPEDAAREVATAAQQGLELGGFVLLAFALAARMRTGRVSAG